jgi:hypothetical protein
LALAAWASWIANNNTAAAAIVIIAAASEAILMVIAGAAQTRHRWLRYGQTCLGPSYDQLPARESSYVIQIWDTASKGWRAEARNSRPFSEY